jgi:hypothetical protein
MYQQGLQAAERSAAEARDALRRQAEEQAAAATAAPPGDGGERRTGAEGGAVDAWDNLARGARQPGVEEEPPPPPPPPSAADHEELRTQHAALRQDYQRVSQSLLHVRGSLEHMEEVRRRRPSLPPTRPPRFDRLGFACVPRVCFPRE